VIPDDALLPFVDACHDIAKRGLVSCSSGNLSCRFDDSTMLVTRTRSWLGRLKPDQVVRCNVDNMCVVSGEKPTVEAAFHAGILRNRPDMNVVLHFQAPFATTLACRSDLDAINFAVIPEVPFYMGEVGIIPYLPPGSPELANAVVEVMKTHDMAVMRNHGLITVAKDYDHVIQNATFFELACQVIVQNGDRLAPLHADAIAELIAAGNIEGGAV
jgi:ribulose-5-phosphate 4-epimerase/fuculose-1-phosphate aldolase